MSEHIIDNEQPKNSSIIHDGDCTINSDITLDEILIVGDLTVNGSCSVNRVEVIGELIVSEKGNLDVNGPVKVGALSVYGFFKATRFAYFLNDNIEFSNCDDIKIGGTGSDS